jgi:hypothetical protein
MKKLLAILGVLTGAGILTVAVYAQAFSGHRGHHGSPALMACLAAAPQSVKANLSTTFSNYNLRADRQAVQAAKQSLTQQIFANALASVAGQPITSLTQLEGNLSAAQLKLMQDQDAIAQSVCSQLTTAQINAASTLYNNLLNNRQTVRGYFQAAHNAANQ